MKLCQKQIYINPQNSILLLNPQNSILNIQPSIFNPHHSILNPEKYLPPDLKWNIFRLNTQYVFANFVTF
jgi:hypothetical protein